MPHFSPVLAWFLVGIAFYVVELVVPGFVIFFFGIGAWCAALAAYLTDISLSSQLLVFLVASLTTLILLRTSLQKIFIGRFQSDEAPPQAQPVATTGVVTEDILPPAPGRVKYGGTFWTARADEPIHRGTVVKIVQQAKLEVKVCPLSGTEEVQ
jgi:membrane protein implicated in regulation of membrane protease activity